MQHEDLGTLARLLLYGNSASRQLLGETLLEEGAERWPLLVSTVRSHEPTVLRGRCLEVLGHAIARADRRTAQTILDALLAQPQTVQVVDLSPALEKL